MKPDDLSLRREESGARTFSLVQGKKQGTKKITMTPGPGFALWFDWFRLTHVSRTLTSARDQVVQEQGTRGALVLRNIREDRRKLHRRILVRLDRLDVAAVVGEMSVPGFNFHSLKGGKPTRYSIHVNGPWCITFEFEKGDAWRVDFEQYH